MSSIISFLSYTSSDSSGPFNPIFTERDLDSEGVKVGQFKDPLE